MEEKEIILNNNEDILEFVKALKKAAKEAEKEYHQMQLRVIGGQTDIDRISRD